MKLILVTLIGLISVAFGNGPAACYFDEITGEYTLLKGEDKINAMKVTPAAWGSFNDSIESSGYGFLEIATSGDYSDEVQMYCAGYLEGHITQKRIHQMFRNFYESTFTAPNTSNIAPILSFTVQNIKWMTQQINDNNETDPYWNQVGLVFTQLKGLVQGYNDKASKKDQISLTMLFILNMIGDLDDLIPALETQALYAKGDNSYDEIRVDEDRIRWALLHSHCSSLIKPSSDYSELFAAHEMWASYLQMLNVFKHYKFALSAKSQSVATEVSFSSYPGLISSEDDFYVLSSEMVVMETTNEIFNMSLYKLVAPSSLMSWVRAIVSNRMSNNGSEWTTNMAKYNSGTYNNQWIIVDYKVVVPGQKVFSPNTVWIGSQIPGYFEAADVTEVLNTQGYWPSYNIPYFKNIFELTGYGSAVEQYGDLWTYDYCPRANIFRKRQGDVETVPDLQKLMRYNDWENDPFSLGCPINQIAARADLSLNTTGFCAVAAFGAINGKITTTSQVKNMGATIIAGPTHESYPPFEWDHHNEKRFKYTYHHGQPKKFDFDWIDFDPSM